MPTSRPAVPLLAALVACIALPATFAERASACSVCLAGDPVFEANGASVGEVGQWNLFIQGSGWKKKSAALPHPHAPEHGGEEHAHPTPEEENRSRRLDLYLGYTPVDRVTLTLNVPFAFNHYEYGDVALVNAAVLVPLQAATGVPSLRSSAPVSSSTSAGRSATSSRARTTRPPAARSSTPRRRCGSRSRPSRSGSASRLRCASRCRSLSRTGGSTGSRRRTRCGASV